MYFFFVFYVTNYLKWGASEYLITILRIANNIVY